MSDLSVLILTYNEGDNIRLVIEKLHPVLQSLVQSYEIVVIDGGSKDQTQEAAAAAGARVVLQKAPGYGAAFREGIEACQGEWIFTLDADLSHDPEVLRKLWPARETAELVIASRYCRGGSAVLPPFRRFLSWFLNTVYRILLEMPIMDLSSGLRLYKRSAVADIPLESRHFDVLEEILIKVYNRGYHVRELPFHYTPRLHGASHLRVVSFGIQYGRTLLRLFDLRHSEEAADRVERYRRTWLLPLKWWRERQKAFLERVAGGRPVLDLGGQALALGLGKVVALDTQPDVLRWNRRRGRGRYLVRPDRLPFEDGAWGCVVVARRDFLSPTALQELSRVLAPGGVLAIDRASTGVDPRPVLRGLHFTYSESGSFVLAKGSNGVGGEDPIDGRDALPSVVCPRCGGANPVWAEGIWPQPWRCLACHQTLEISEGVGDLRPRI